MNFIELEETKERLGITDTASDELIDQLILRACAMVEHTTGRRYAPPPEIQEVPEYLNGNGIRQIRLVQPPEASGDAPVVEREASVGVWEVVPAADYQIIGRELVHNDGWQKGTNNYRVTYARGYLVSSEDPEYMMAREAAFDLVSQTFAGSGNEGIKSESIGSYSYDLTEAGSTSTVPDSLIKLRGWVYA